MPLPELARRFQIAKVGRSAGVFDSQKLAWVNRHYLRRWRLRGWRPWRFRSSRRRGGPVRSTNPAGHSSVTSPNWRPGMSIGSSRYRIASSFCSRSTFAEALSKADIQHAVGEADARRVIVALAATLAASPRLDADRFRQIKTAVRTETGCKGRALVHPIRVALTGRTDGMELERAVPAIDRGAELAASTGVGSILGCRERAAAFAAALERTDT